jgi:hypothetical protein
MPPASVVVIGAMPSLAMTSGSRYRADWISRVSRPSRPRPLTIKSWACVRTHLFRARLEDVLVRIGPDQAGHRDIVALTSRAMSRGC